MSRTWKSGKRRRWRYSTAQKARWRDERDDVRTGLKRTLIPHADRDKLLRRWIASHVHRKTMITTTPRGVEAFIIAKLARIVPNVNVKTFRIKAGSMVEVEITTKGCGG